MGPENEEVGETVLGKALSWERAERAKAGDRDEGSRGTSHTTWMEGCPSEASM